MAYTLLDTAQQRWRRLTGHEADAAVLAGATFNDGIRVTDHINNVQMTDEKGAACAPSRRAVVPRRRRVHNQGRVLC
jgi:hypothetical protein